MTRIAWNVSQMDEDATGVAIGKRTATKNTLHINIASSGVIIKEVDILHRRRSQSLYRSSSSCIMLYVCVCVCVPLLCYTTPMLLLK